MYRGSVVPIVAAILENLLGVQRAVPYPEKVHSVTCKPRCVNLPRRRKVLSEEDLCQKLRISQEDIVALTEIMVLNFGKSLFTYYVQELVSHGNFSWRFFKPSLQIFAMNDYHPETGDFKVSISMVKL